MKNRRGRKGWPGYPRPRSKAVVVVVRVPPDGLEILEESGMKSESFQKAQGYSRSCSNRCIHAAARGRLRASSSKILEDGEADSPISEIPPWVGGRIWHTMAFHENLHISESVCH